MSYEERIARLEAAIARIKSEKEAEALARRESVTPTWAYSVTPDDQERRFNKVYDESVTCFKLSGRCTNRDEVEAVGGTVNQDGGMSYYFNWATGRIICSTGGGTVYIADRSWSYGKNADKPDDAPRAMEELSNFIVKNPEGGDVTSLILAHKQRQGS